jgi:hypothetical protein
MVLCSPVSVIRTHTTPLSYYDDYLPLYRKGVHKEDSEEKQVELTTVF